MAGGFNAQLIVDFDDVVGVGPAAVDGLDLVDASEVGTDGRQVVLARLVVELHVGTLDTGDALQAEVTDLLFQLQEHGVRRRVLRQRVEVLGAVHVRDEGQHGGVLLLVRDDVKASGAREFLTHFRTGHVLLRHVGLVEVKDEAPLGHVGLDGRNVDGRGDFEGSRQLLCVLCSGLDALFEVDLHGRGVGHLACIDNLDDAGQTLGHVDRGHTGVVERTHGHLRAGFTERLSRHDARGFEGVDAGLRQFGLGACDDLAGLCSGELLLATLQHSVRQIVQDTNRQLKTGFVGGLLERGIHRIVGEFRAEGLHLAALVVALQVNVGLDAAAAALAKGDFGGWATAIAVAIAGFARGSLD